MEPVILLRAREGSIEFRSEGGVKNYRRGYWIEDRESLPLGADVMEVIRVRLLAFLEFFENSPPPPNAKAEGPRWIFTLGGPLTALYGERKGDGVAFHWQLGDNSRRFFFADRHQLREWRLTLTESGECH